MVRGGGGRARVAGPCHHRWSGRSPKWSTPPIQPASPRHPGRFTLQQAAAPGAPARCSSRCSRPSIPRTCRDCCRPAAPSETAAGRRRVAGIVYVGTTRFGSSSGSDLSYQTSYKPARDSVERSEGRILCTSQVADPPGFASHRRPGFRQALDGGSLWLGLALFPSLLVDTQSLGELVLQDDDPARRLERSAFVNELTGPSG